MKLLRKIAVFVLAFSAFTGFGFGYSERPLWPVQGIITQGYGGRYGHTGIDIAAPIGTPVYASLSGRVNYASWNPFGYGNFITVLIGFLIIAAILFQMVKISNRMKKATPPTPPPGPSATEKLLAEIRDALNAQNVALKK